MTEEEAGRLYEWAVHVAMGLNEIDTVETLNIAALTILNDRQVWVHAAVNAGSAE